MTGRQKVSEMIRELVPFWRNRLTRDELALAVHLRGNSGLMKALRNTIQARISGRAALPEQSIDPIVCKTMLARDRELQWLLARLEFVFASPANSPAEDAGEPPA